MDTPEKNHAGTGNIPFASVRKKTDFSLVWVIPIVAVFIAGGLAYKAVTGKGPTVTITFESAEGVEANKTRIKYKDVEVGKVETLSLSKDLKRVIVTARMIKGTERYLTDKTRFWVVRPRLAAGSVSGLETLLSGGYIAIDPGRAGKPKSRYTGLEIPPVIMSNQPGQRFRLKAPRLGSLEQGSPVYYRGIKVGQVEGYELSEQGNSVGIQVFIEAPHDKNVVSSSRFWFASGLDVDLSAKGLRLDTQSLISFLIGGLAFTNPDHLEKGHPVAAGTVLPIYDSVDEAMAVKYAEKDYYLLKFNHSVRGLSMGAPVDFRGFAIGEVAEINLEADWTNNQINVLVKIVVEPDRLRGLTVNNDDPRNNLENLIHMGLRAQLQTGNIISGSKFVALDFFESADPASVVVHDDIIELPTIPPALDELSGSLTSLLNNFEKLPLEKLGDAALKTFQSINETSGSFKDMSNSVTGLVSSDATKKSLDNLNKSLEHIRRLTAEIDQGLPDKLDTVSEKAIETLTGIQKVTAPNSALFFELKRTLREFSKTAQSIRTLADHLERHPESIIQGKGKEK